MSPAKHIWTFLTTPRTLGRGKVLSPRKRRRRRGIALVTVMIAIAFTFVLSNQFGASTNIDLIAAANYRDQMRSQFLARSAMNLSELVIRLQQRLDNMRDQVGVVQITDFADQVLLAFCGSSEEVMAAVGFDSNTTKGLGADVGTCGIVGQITTEDDKINVNCANASGLTPDNLRQTIYSMMFFPAYDPLFEEEDAEGYRRDREKQADAIVDYVDTNTYRGSNSRGGAMEDYGYESLKDQYKAKNNYIDTVGELKLVRGVDDRFWTLFGSAFTAYGECKINLSALSNSQLIAGILYLTAKNKNDPLLQNPQKLFLLAGLVAKAKQFGQTFDKTQQFIDFVKDPVGQLGSLAGTSTMEGSAASAAISAGIPGLAPGEKIGLELDPALVNQMATAGPRRTYRVQAWGEIERKQVAADGSPVFPPIRSTITGVWNTRVVPQNVRKPPQPKGAWVFMRED
jgi:type II secretory pathway component PulK